MAGKLKPKKQVVYIPMHAVGRLDHPDCEEGFITSINRDEDGRIVTVFCRFWSKYHGGLRTKLNSEGCNPESLVLKDTRSQELVDRIYEELGYG